MKSKPAAHATEEKPPDQKPLCFVIGPIGLEGSEVRKRSNMLLKYIIRPALQDSYDVKRSDSDARPGSITDQLIVDINRAKLIIADLSNLNPNAFYELKVAHTLDKEVIRMSGSTDLPFDIRDYRSVFFDPMDPDGHERTISELKTAAQSIRQDQQPLNPVSRALGRHEFIKSQDAKQPSVEQLFRDIDTMKAQIRQLYVLSKRPKVSKPRNPFDYVDTMFLLREEIRSFGGGWVRNIETGEDFIRIEIARECPDKEGLESNIVNMVHRLAPHLSTIHVSEV